MTGPPAPVPAGPRGTATSAMATGFPISIGFAVPIVATSFCILSQGVSVSPKPVLAGGRSRSLSVCCRWFCYFSEVGRGLKLSAKGERGDVRGSWTPRARTSRFPFRTDRMSFAGRIPRFKTRETGIGCPFGRRPISVSSGSADPMTFLAVFLRPQDWEFLIIHLPLAATPIIFRRLPRGHPFFNREGTPPPPGSVEL